MDAHSFIATARKELRRLIVITMKEVKSLIDLSQLVHLIKKKLCDLAVRGTIVELKALNKRDYPG
jgi:hypothetical protein